MSDEWRGMKTDAISFVPESLLEDLVYLICVSRRVTCLHADVCDDE